MQPPTSHNTTANEPNITNDDNRKRRCLTAVVVPTSFFFSSSFLVSSADIFNTFGAPPATGVPATLPAASVPAAPFAPGIVAIGVNGFGGALIPIRPGGLSAVSLRFSSTDAASVEPVSDRVAEGGVVGRPVDAVFKPAITLTVAGGDFGMPEDWPGAVAPAAPAPAISGGGDLAGVVTAPAAGDFGAPAIPPAAVTPAAPPAPAAAPTPSAGLVAAEALRSAMSCLSEPDEAGFVPVPVPGVPPREREAIPAIGVGAAPAIAPGAAVAEGGFVSPGAPGGFANEPLAGCAGLGGLAAVGVVSASCAAVGVAAAVGVGAA